MNELSSLQQLVDDGVVDEVLQKIKSGKEADVYLVRKGESLLAAKVYKARIDRNFKNNAGYLEGRTVRSSRDARAVAKGSRYGRSQQEEAWKHAEVDALYKLAAAGVRVPAPDVFYEGVLVMALVVDAEGYPAPRLADMTFEPQQATALYTDLLRQVGTMLSCDLIHGDLSAFNVLLAHDGPTIIDLPQVISAAANPQAEMFFRRDVRNLHQFFSQFARELTRHPDGGADLWNRYRRRELFAGYVPDLSALKDDAPVPTFKPRSGNRPKRHGHGPRPEVSFKGQPARRPQNPQHPHPQHPHPQHPQHPQHPRPQHPQHGQAPRPAPQHPHPQHPQHGQAPRPAPQPTGNRPAAQKPSPSPSHPHSQPRNPEPGPSRSAHRRRRRRSRGSH